jgi:hypothetical protein
MMPFVQAIYFCKLLSLGIGFVIVLVKKIGHATLRHVPMPLEEASAPRSMALAWFH